MGREEGKQSPNSAAGIDFWSSAGCLGVKQAALISVEKGILQFIQAEMLVMNPRDVPSCSREQGQEQRDESALQRCLGFTFQVGMKAWDA